MAMNTIQWSKTVGLTDYNEPFYVAADTKIWDWRKIYDTGKSTRATEAWYTYSGIPAPELTGELEEVSFETPVELDAITLSTVKYARGWILSEEMEDDNLRLPGLLSKMAKSLGAGHGYIQDMAATYPFNQAFSSTYQTVWDGTELCGTHTTKVSADTITNEQTAASLSKDSIWDMIKYFDYGIVTQDGLPASDTPKFLIAHPSKRDIIEKIFESPMESDTTDNNKNTLSNKGITVIYNRLLTDTERYFLVGSKMKDYLIYRQRKPITVKWKDAFTTIGKMCRTHQRFMCGPISFEYIVGNDG